MECPICYEDEKKFHTCDLCMHVICINCKDAWGRDCPFCRQLYSPTSMPASPTMYVEAVEIMEHPNPFGKDCIVKTSGCLLLCGFFGFASFMYT